MKIRIVICYECVNSETITQFLINKPFISFVKYRSYDNGRTNQNQVGEYGQEFSSQFHRSFDLR